MTQDITWNKMIIGILETTWKKKSVVENFELKFKLKDRKSVLFMRMLFYHLLLITTQRRTVLH